MEVHSCSLNLQHSGCSGFIEIGVLHEKRSRSRQRSGWNLDGEVDDAEAGGLLGDDGDVAEAGDGVGHAGVEARLREEANIGGAGAGGGARESDWISTEIAAVRRGVESAKGGNVEIERSGGIIDAGGGGLDGGDIFAGDGGGRGGERNDVGSFA